MSGSEHVLERDPALSAVDRLLERCRGGRGGALFVLGEAGLGKSAILDEARHRAAPPHRVSSGRGDAMESWIPYGLIGQAIDELGGPSLLPLGAAVPALSPHVRASQFMEVQRWLQRMSGPALIALDDLHWADSDSLALLAFFVRRLAFLPVAVVGTLRPWPPEVEDRVSRLAHDGYAEIERLSPLSDAAADRVIASRVGGPVDDGLLKRCRSLCAGNPLLLEQVALAISKGEDIPAVEGERRRLVSQGLLLAQFAGLSDEGLRCAQAGSVLGTRFRPQVAAEVALPGEGAADAAIDALCRSGLVRPAGGSLVEFVHPLFAQALYEEMMPGTRTHLHARAFGVLAGHGLEREAAEHAVRGDLVGSSEAIALLRDAGQNALRTGVLATAAIHLKGAVTLAADRAPHDLLLMLGEALLASGRVGEARSTYDRLLSVRPMTRRDRGRALWMLGRTLQAAGHQAEAAIRYEQAAGLLRDEDPSAAVGALLDHALSSSRTIGPATSLEVAQRAREVAAGADKTARRRADAACGYMLVQMGDASGLEAIEAAASAVEAELAAGELDWTGFTVLTTYAQAAGLVEWFAEVERVCRLGRAFGERVGVPEAIASLDDIEAWTLTRRGRLREALELADRASALDDLVPELESYVAVSHAHVMLHMARLDESETWCARADATAAARGQTIARLYVGEIRGHRALREGRLGQAADQYAALEALVRGVGGREPCEGTWARHAVRAFLGCDREDDAARVVAWLESCAEGLPCRYPRIAAATGRALLAERGGDREAAEVHFRAALALHEETEQRIEEVETLLEYGAFLRRSGRQSQARPSLARALALARQIGAEWLADYVAAELEVAGGRRRQRGTLDRLTAQERRVAALAAAGLSNREIAGQISLSPRTIESHLERIYAKLGIRSRRQLMTMELARVRDSVESRTI